MDGMTNDIWSDFMLALTPLTNDRCEADPKGVAPSLETLMDELLAIAYDRDTTPKQVTRVIRAIQAAYQLGRSNQALSIVLNRKV